MLQTVLLRRTAKVVLPLAVLCLLGGCGGEANQTPAFPEAGPVPSNEPVAKKPQPGMDRVGSEQGRPNP